jgi:hypothetical protein
VKERVKARPEQEVITCAFAEFSREYLPAKMPREPGVFESAGDEV